MEMQGDSPFIGTADINAIRSRVIVPPNPNPEGRMYKKCCHAAVDVLSVESRAVPVNWNAHADSPSQ